MPMAGESESTGTCSSVESLPGMTGGGGVGRLGRVTGRVPFEGGVAPIRMLAEHHRRECRKKLSAGGIGYWVGRQECSA